MGNFAQYLQLAKLHTHTRVTVSKNHNHQRDIFIDLDNLQYLYNIVDMHAHISYMMFHNISLKFSLYMIQS